MTCRGNRRSVVRPSQRLGRNICNPFQVFASCSRTQALAGVKQARRRCCKRERERSCYDCSIWNFNVCGVGQRKRGIGCESGGEEKGARRRGWSGNSISGLKHTDKEEREGEQGKQGEGRKCRGREAGRGTRWCVLTDGLALGVRGVVDDDSSGESASLRAKRRQGWT